MLKSTGTEPYVVGGHTASGYWVDNNRQTTIPGLYAAGDVAGGCPQKYVTGALVEGEIAAEAAGAYIERSDLDGQLDETAASQKQQAVEKFLHNPPGLYTVQQLEEAMQKTMDEYAGGIAKQYRYSEKELVVAERKIKEVSQLTESLAAKDMYDLLKIFELQERLLVCRALIAHLAAREGNALAEFCGKC